MPYVQWLTIILTIAASALSLWVTIETKGTNRLPGCGTGSDCSAVASSRWSRWGPIPVSVFGVIAYASLACLEAGFIYSRAPAPQHFAASVGMVLAFAVLGAIAWFVLLQAAVLKKVCLYCNLIHFFGAAGGTLVLWQVFRKADVKALAGTEVFWPVMGSVGCLAVLIAGQLLWRPKLYAVIQSDAPICGTVKIQYNDAKVSPLADVSPTDRSTLSCSPPTGTVAREASLLNHRVQVNTLDWPLIGSAEAHELIAVLFDYTCKTCRRTHQIIRDSIAANPGSFAAIEIPIPQHPACNPTVEKIEHGRGYACEYAYLALGLWQERPECYCEFADYMFAEKDPPPLGLAIAKASELAGVSINPRQPDERTKAMIRRAIDIYRSLDEQRVPQILLPSATILGKVESVAEFQKVLRQNLKGQSVVHA